MEHIIGKLLRDYEHGKMTRRQLIQTLALTATAASTVGTADSPSAPLTVGPRRNNPSRAGTTRPARNGHAWQIGNRQP